MRGAGRRRARGSGVGGGRVSEVRVERVGVVRMRPQALSLLFSFFLVFLCVGFLSLLPSQSVLCFFNRGLWVTFLD